MANYLSPEQFQRRRDFTTEMIGTQLQPQQNQNALGALARILAIRQGKKRLDELGSQEEQQQARKSEELSRILSAGRGQEYVQAEGGGIGMGPPAPTQGGRDALIAAMSESEVPDFQSIALQSQLAQPKQRDQKIIKVGVEGQPELEQNAIVQPDGSIMPVGPPMRRGSGTTVNVGTGKGQEALDKEFGKDAAEFLSGGYADVQKNLDQLRSVQSDLQAVASGESDKDLTGALVGNTPDFMLQFTNPEALNSRELVEEVVQRNLREVLGAQFTEKEGERLISRAYNPRLSEKANAERVGRLVQQIGNAAQSKVEAMEYFDKNGTLKGFQGRVYTASDFDPDNLFSDSSDKETDEDDEIDSLVNKYAP